MSIPLVTVTCQRDLPLLDLQAQSFDRFLYEGSSIIIIVNEKDPTEWNEFFFNNIEQWYRRHHYTILYRKDFDIDWELFYKNEVVTGWLRQQILKLAISVKIENDFYFILDSQNFLVNYWSFKSRIVDNKAPCRTNHLGWATKPYKDYSELFGLPSDNDENKMSISTPIYMNTDLIKKLIKTHRDIKGFSKWFFNYGEEKSEFALYLAWMEFNGGVDRYHYKTHNWVHPMLRDSFDFEKDVEYFVENLAKITVHRWSSINFRAWLDMKPEHLKLVSDKLKLLGLDPNFKKFRQEYREPF